MLLTMVFFVRLSCVGFWYRLYVHTFNNHHPGRQNRFGYKNWTQVMKQKTKTKKEK